MNPLKMLDSLFKKLPMASLIKTALLVVLVTKIFSFKVELGDWGNSALNVMKTEYKSLTKNPLLKGGKYD
jgi:hypothetical protein